MADQVILENEDWQAVIAPDKGAGLLSLSARHDGAWLPVMPDARAADCDLEWASFLMVPYSNRIENGVFSFAGQTYALENGENHAIHGDVRSRPWQVEECGPTYARCSFLSADHEAVNWPWPFSVRAEYDLLDTVFSCRLTLTNCGSSPFPAGLGWHPYFSRTLTRADEPVELQVSVFAVYPDANDNRIPSGPSTPPPAALDFAQAKAVDPDLFFDICGCGYDGAGFVQWPASGLRLRFACSTDLDHLVLYNPTGKPYFAVEPVTNANNGVNLHAQGDPTSGIVVLAPEEALAARFDVGLERL